MIISFLLHIIVNALAILTAEWLVPGVIYKYEFLSLIKIALILALANILLKPILKMIFGPFILLTLGFFTIAINIFLIWLVVYFVPELSIVSFNAYFWTMIIISFFNFIVSAASHRQKAKI
ncbi:MAG: phage holin family protein [Candidatus Azambacteria bacterium]|nr:phage holin family protein [Candidatus Azambacteria bacterium]